MNMELPHNAEAERTILGAILVDNAGLVSADALLVPEDFYIIGHRRIFEAMKKLAAAGSEIDLVTVMHRLKADEAFESSGGVAYLAGLVEGVPNLVDLAPWCDVVKEAARMRSVHN